MDDEEAIGGSEDELELLDDDDEVADEAGSDTSDDEEEPPLRTADEAASFSSASNANVQSMHVLPENERRGPPLLDAFETAAVIATWTAYIADNGTQLPPQVTETFSFVDFNMQAAIEEIRRGLAPLKIRRILGELPNGEKIVEEFKLSEMVKPHLK